MPELTQEWRPPPRLRAIAIGLVWRGPRLLASAVTEDDGRIKGWRPLGGGIEFGETAEEALRREFREEIGATLGPLGRRAVLENLFSHHGARGHEIVFVLEGELTAPGQAAKDRFILEDGPFRNQAGWLDRDLFLKGHETLLPEGLLDHI